MDAQYEELRALLRDIEGRRAILKPGNLRARAGALEALDGDVILRIRYLMAEAGDGCDELATLHDRAVALKQELEALNERLFLQVREDTRSGACRGRALGRLLERYVGPVPATRARFGPTYDTLDDLVDGFLGTGAPPAETVAREPEMVYLQPTPARLVLDMVEKAGIGPEDVFYDIGSGLGQVPILVSLLSGARAVGVELEPAYCERASGCAAALNATRVTFVCCDVRTADLGPGTVFYLYTPFHGKILCQFMDRLGHEAQARPITVCTYGPCTHDVAEYGWLAQVSSGPLRNYTLAVFRSR